MELIKRIIHNKVYNKVRREGFYHHVGIYLNTTVYSNTRIYMNVPVYNQLKMKTKHDFSKKIYRNKDV